MRPSRNVKGQLMISRRRVALGVVAGAFAPLATFAQQQPVRWRIGVLQLSSKEFFVQGGYQKAFLDGMRARGYVLGSDFVIEERFADGDVGRLPTLVAELTRIPVDLILTSGTQANRAAQQATTTIPVVTVAEADPVGNGLAVTLARPGKNITGLSTLFGDTIIKNVELLTSIVPKLTRLAVLTNPSNQGSQGQLAAIRSVAPKGGMVVLPFDALAADDIAPAIERMQREKAQALLVLPDSIFSSQMDPRAIDTEASPPVLVRARPLCRARRPHELRSRHCKQLAPGNRIHRQDLEGSKAWRPAVRATFHFPARP